ncbi:glutathione S-transferase family protein [Pseudovibrio axinellae]|nr:glutathione S-transferase C-terminal domain-containing protein [Pseudovibrio axinellae]
MPKILIGGALHERPVEADGTFRRMPSSYRHEISKSPDAMFPAAKGRYHLYLSKACPWCHGVELVISLKGLQETISITWMDPLSSQDGWVLKKNVAGEVAGAPQVDFLYQVYQYFAPDYTGPITVPLLIDRDRGQIVSTESAEMMRMFNSSFNGLGAMGPELYPDELVQEIDRITDMIQAPIREGVYRAGFASSQQAYCEAVFALFDALEQVEQVLTSRRFLAGEQITEVDLKFYPTLVRFDAVYVTHFKADYKRISDYPALTRYFDEISALPDVTSTIDMPQIREHYFRSHTHINPTGIIPIGPAHSLVGYSRQGGTV